MARAGFCSECGANVYLDASGACPQGHGPECVSGTYEVPDPPEAPAGGQPASVSAPVPAYTAAPVTATPKKKRTGLVIALIVVALLLVCGCGIGGFFLFAAPDSKQSSGTSSESTQSKVDTKGEIEAAYAFLKGMGSGDVELFKTVMPRETVDTVPKETWDGLFADAASSPTSFGALEWAGDTASATFNANDGSNGSMEFRAPDTDTVLVTLKPEASESEEATFTVRLENDRWTVTQFETVDGALKFDPESVKALGQ